MEIKLPLWSVMATVTPISLIFIGHPDYTLNYIAGFNAVFWGLTGVVYAGEFCYHKFLY